MYESTPKGVVQVLDADTYRCYISGMPHDSAAGLIKYAREAKGLSQAELGRRIGALQQTIDKIEKGTIKHSRLFPKLAAELELPLESLIPGAASSSQGLQEELNQFGGLTGAKDLPVHAATMGGPGEMIVSTDPIDWVLRPDPLRNVSGGYGVIVVGESMIPEFRAGDIALVNPHLPPMRGETYIFYSANEGDTHSTIKHLMRWTDAAWIVQQWNPPKGKKAEFSLLRKEWPKLHRVVGKYSR